MPRFKSSCFSLYALAGISVASPALAQEMTFSGTSASGKPPAATPSSSPVPANAADMQAVLDAQKALDAKPIEMLTPAQAREQPTPADAVKRVLKQKGLPTEPDPSVTTAVKSYGSADKEEATIYKPKGAPGPLPVIVYYRHAPEFKFPAQHDDAAMAYQWVLKNANSWGGDTSHVALAGESAGGNLAIATAIFARDHQLPPPVAILSVYPIANSDMMLPSKAENRNTKPLNTAMLTWFTHYYAKAAADVQDPRINLVNADLHGLPPTTIINAQNDPLRSDGETLAAAMRAAGDQVQQKTFPGVTHEFFGMGKVVQGAMDAETYAVARLKPAL